MSTCRHKGKIVAEQFSLTNLSRFGGIACSKSKLKILQKHFDIDELKIINKIYSMFPIAGAAFETRIPLNDVVGFRCLGPLSIAEERSQLYPGKLCKKWHVAPFADESTGGDYIYIDLRQILVDRRSTIPVLQVFHDAVFDDSTESEFDLSGYSYVSPCVCCWLDGAVPVLDDRSP